jgi:hypothetical protein
VGAREEASRSHQPDEPKRRLAVRLPTVIVFCLYASGPPSARSIVEKMLKVRATFDYRSRSLLQVRLYSFPEQSPDPHLSALFQGNFIRSVPNLRVLFQNRIDLLSEAHVRAPQIVFGHVRFPGSSGAGVAPATLSGAAEGSGSGCNSELGFCGMSGKSGGRTDGLTGSGSGSRL